MTSQNSIPNPVLSEALASMAGIGQAIGRAVGSVGLPPLGLPGIRTSARSDEVLENRSDPAAPNNERSLIDLSKQPTESASPDKNAPPIPERKPIRKQVDSIDEAIQQAVKARELAGVDGNIREGVRAIEEVGRSFQDQIDKLKNPLTDGVREGEKPTFWSRFDDARWIGELAGGAAGLLGGPSFGAAVGGGATGLALGGYVLYDEAHPEPFSMAEISKRNLRGLQELTELALGSETGLTAADRAFLFQQFQAAWMAWNSFLEDLVRNIESSDSSSEAAKLRSDSLEILPKIISDTEHGMELYRQLLPDDVQNLNRELLDKAIRLRNGVDYSGSPSQHRDDAFHPRRVSHNSTFSPGVSPVAFTSATSLPRDWALNLASYNVPRPLGSPPTESDQPTSQPGTSARASLEELMEKVLARLNEPLRLEPIRLEVRLLDDRVIARRLDGNRSVDVDLSRGYRMVGYISV